jgi:cytochrome d ubiquinol oxidase subunit II
MVEAAFAALALMLAGFTVFEGWTFGAGAVMPLVARTAEERRAVVAAIGPLWSWREVWLVAAGGVLFAAFPAALATALSGYYLAVMMLIWCLLLRGIALEFGGHLDDALWQRFWHTVLWLASTLLAVLFGAALGNVIRGVPLGPGGRFLLPLFTDLRARGQVGLLDWYTMAVAAFALAALGAHGATYLVPRTAGAVRERAWRVARGLWVVTAGLLVAVSLATARVRPDFFPALVARPLAILALVAAVAGLGGILVALRAGRAGPAVAASCLTLAALLGGAAAVAWPVMLHSTLDPAHGLTAHAAAASPYGLGLAARWWPVALVLSVGYAAWVARQHARGPEEGAGGDD